MYAYVSVRMNKRRRLIQACRFCNAEPANLQRTPRCQVRAKGVSALVLALCCFVLQSWVLIRIDDLCLSFFFFFFLAFFQRTAY